VFAACVRFGLPKRGTNQLAGAQPGRIAEIEQEAQPLRRGCRKPK
jgi:hypothetical protein